MNTRVSFVSKVATSLTAIALLSSCGGGPPIREQAASRDPVRVTVVVAARQELPVFVEGVGTVEARTEATIAARVMGYIETIHVREGDRVTAGQTLAVLSATEMTSAVEQAQSAGQEAQSARAEVESAIAAAESQAKLAETTLGRMRNLHERKSISDQEFDEALARHEAAQAGLRMARSKRDQVSEKIQQSAAVQRSAETQLAYLRIHSPFAGVVTARMAEPGNLATPGAPLLRIEQTGAYRLSATFPEAVLGQLKVGQHLPIVIDAIGMKTDGTVAEVAPVVDSASRTVAVKITLPGHAALRSGIYGKALAPSGSRESLRIAASAVRGIGQLSSVFVADAGVARSRMVKLGEEREGMREVLSGLNPGEVVVLNPPAGLRDGDPVEVAQ